MDIINYSKDILFTNMQRLCMMFAAYEVSFIVQDEINEVRENEVPQIALWLSIFDIGLLFTTTFGNIMLYNTLIVWQIVQGIVFCILIFLGFKTFLEKKSKRWNLLLSGILLMCTILLEFMNEYVYLWKQGMLWKFVFVICLLHHLIEGIRTVPKNYRAAKETERLKRELKNSRVVLATSQIRTHFIFNILNAISGMCLYDPAEANRTVVHFAKYLRGNINILQEDELISFRKELDHLEDYIVLEKVRFEDKIQYVKELEVEEFLIPPLILQPIVENAIKHGLLRCKKGGVIKLKTRNEKEQIVIEITDNGAGFDVLAPFREGAVGISNVKFRLEYMIKGNMEIESVPGKGTTVIIRMPYVVL
jgi:sensor histidine kinase YesM